MMNLMRRMSRLDLHDLEVYFGLWSLSALYCEIIIIKLQYHLFCSSSFVHSAWPAAVVMRLQGYSVGFRLVSPDLRSGAVGGLGFVGGLRVLES